MNWSDNFGVFNLRLFVGCFPQIWNSNFTDQSSIIECNKVHSILLSFPQFSCELSLRFNGHTLGNRNCVGKNNNKCIFRDGEAHGVLVSLCRPVNCNACHSLHINITVSRWGTSGASCFLLLRKDALLYSYISLSNYFWAFENGEIMYKNFYHS